MRSFQARLAVLAIVALLALAAVATGTAKDTTLFVVKPASLPRAGVPWTVTVHVTYHGNRHARAGWVPTLYLVEGAGIPVTTFHGVLAAPGRFRVRIVFPRAGTWRYVIPDPLNGEWSFGGLHVGG